VRGGFRWLGIGIKVDMVAGILLSGEYSSAWDGWKRAFAFAFVNLESSSSSMQCI
jgi:hypothetical protein